MKPLLVFSLFFFTSFTTLLATEYNNIIRKCEVENCEMGILCYGSNNLLTENYIHEKLADPLFVDIENKDFRLKAGSPAIDNGADSLWPNPTSNQFSLIDTLIVR